MAQPALSATPAAPRPRIEVVYQVEPRDELFLLEEETMPESPLHDQTIDLLKSLMKAWSARSGRSLFVARNLACRWEPSDARLGVDPDLCLVEPAPADLDTMKQLRLWEGHAAPFLAIEVVSGATAAKDYLAAPVSYARLGAREVWVFDPLREGPADTGGPFVLQVWRRDGDRMERIYAGDGPAESPELGAWLVVTDGGRRLRLSDDASGQQLWPTEAEVEALARQQEQATREQERAARERALAERDDAEAARTRAEAEVAALRAELAALRSGRELAGQPLKVERPASPNGSSRSRTAWRKPTSAARCWNA